MASDNLGDLTELVARNLEDVRTRINRAGGSDATQIVAVTKGHGPEFVLAAHRAGARLFGENYADELAVKAASPLLASSALSWTFQGRLQTNKINRLGGLVSLWQTVDTVERGIALQKRLPQARVLVQLNLTGASQRGGVRLEDADQLMEGLKGIGLRIEGVMGIGPDSTDSNPGSFDAFKLAVNFADRYELVTRSLGMSDDFEAAIAAGSTMVRLGSALFGARPTP
jgi:PLP dependent protein